LLKTPYGHDYSGFCRGRRHQEFPFMVRSVLS
jgi:hypothetical protein